MSAPHATDHLLPLPDGRALWVHDVAGPRGDSPALVLVHGLGVTAHLTWRRSYAALAERFRVLALNLRGHGRGLRTRHFTLDDCAGDVLTVLDSLSVSRAVLVGYSLGGPVAKLAWRRAPKRVAGLVLAATASEFARGPRAKRLRPLISLLQGFATLRPDYLRRQMIQRTAERLAGAETPEEIAREMAGHDPVTLVQAIREAGDFSSSPWLATINVPVAVLVTADDDRVPAEHQRALAAAIPTARVLEAPGTHTACATRADTFAPRLVQACSDVWMRAALQPSLA